MFITPDGKPKKFILQLLFIVMNFILIFGTIVLLDNYSAASGNNSSTLKFAQVSDVHFDSKSEDNSKRLYSQSIKLLNDAIDQINHIEDLDFVIFSGDSVNRSDKNDFTKFISAINKLKAPWYLSTGNHEIGILGGMSKSERLNIINKHNKYIKSDKSYYSFSPKKGYLVIVMDGVIDLRVTANGYFPKNELEWLDNQLADNKNSKVIIVQHFPVVEPYESEDHRVINAQEYQQVLNKHNNVIAVLTGHYHTTKITRIQNILHVSSPALVEYPNAFRIISISDKNGQIQIDFDFKETRLKNLQQISKSRSKSWQLNQGKETDRNTSIIINK